MNRSAFFLLVAAILVFLGVKYSSGQTYPQIGLASNDISYLGVQGTVLWVGTDKGLSRSLGNGDTSDDWLTYGTMQGLGGPSISAMHISGDNIWVATTDENGETGMGISFSPDGGDSWYSFKPSVLIGRGRTVWGIAAKGREILDYNLAVSDDGGENWRTLAPEQSSPTPHAFSVLKDNKYLWCGTGTGVHRTEDEGNTWEKFDFSSGSLPGDWVVRLELQADSDGPLALWASCRALADGQENGLARYLYREGRWEIVITGYQVWDLAFGRDFAWAAADRDGLLRSPDNGESWEKIGKANGLSPDKIYAVEVIGETIWVGSDDGLCRSMDGGNTWQIIRTSPPTAALGTLRVYAYPNPFSPMRNQVAKIRYSSDTNTRVSVDLYNSAHERIRRLADQQEVDAGKEMVTLWDGRTDKGSVAANGVYFIRVVNSAGVVAWGKIIVLD